MSSLKQIEANRRNAQRSTGPRTAAGKDRSKMNAVTHGLTAKTVVIGQECPKAFAALRDSLLAQIQPHSAVERELVERLAGLFWRLRRVPRFEAALLQTLQLQVRREQAGACEEQSLPPPDHLQPNLGPTQRRKDWQQATAELAQEPAVLGLALIEDAKQHNAFGKLSRYEWSLMRSAERTLWQLRLFRTSVRPPRALVKLGLVDDAD